MIERVAEAYSEATGDSGHSGMPLVTEVTKTAVCEGITFLTRNRRLLHRW